MSTAEVIRRGDLDFFRLQLIDKGNDFLREYDSEGYASIHWAAYFDEPHIVEYIIGCDPSIILLKTKNGQTPLHLSVLQSSVRTLVVLSKYGVLDAPNNFQETALHLAAASGNKAVIAMLVEAGCVQSVMDKWGRSAIDVAIENGYKDSVEGVLDACFISKKSKNEDMVSGKERVQFKSLTTEFMGALNRKVMSRPRPEVDSPSTTVVRTIFDAAMEVVPLPTAPESTNSRTQVSRGRMALSKLLEYPGDPTMLLSLLTSGDYEINGRDMFGLSALHKCASWDKVDLVDILLLWRRSPMEGLSDVLDSASSATEDGESVDINLRVGDKTGRTALHCCVESGAYRAARRLVADNRLDRSARDSSGLTAMDLALRGGDQAMIDILRGCE